MTRFFVGFVVGAFFLALIQYYFDPIPTSDYRAGLIDVQRQVFSDRELDVSRGNSLRTPDATDGADNRPQGVDVEVSTLNAAMTATAESELDQTGKDRTRAMNPIQLPDTHAGFVEKSTPSLPDEHAKVEDEDVDPGWSEHVESLIYSFINSHPNGAQIQIVSLVCRTTRCEIVGSIFGENGGDMWNTVVSEMRIQPWFSSNFADSMFGSGGAYPGEYRFVLILARVGSEIGPPVPQ